MFIFAYTFPYLYAIICELVLEYQPTGGQLRGLQIPILIWKLCMDIGTGTWHIGQAIHGKT